LLEIHRPKIDLENESINSNLAFFRIKKSAKLKLAINDCRLNILDLNDNMKSEVEIRFAARGDAELLSKLGRDTFHDAFVNHPLMPKADLELYLNEAFTIQQITSELNDTQAAFLLAEIDGQAVGYAKLVQDGCEPVLVTKNPVKLKRLYARREFIGAGIGAGLLSRCLDEAEKSGHDTIWLSVWEHNRRAQEFYRRWDFKPFGVIDFQLGNTMLTDILMQRPL
jgi:GNAT superfamily N-acetyltransferase